MPKGLQSESFTSTVQAKCLTVSAKSPSSNPAKNAHNDHVRNDFIQTLMFAWRKKRKKKKKKKN